ncbi:hypothetical protein MYAM1_002516 [Malassezia yamatoensis]|uniref:Uncharacterized protein n=1 Tax=Malassezia yamatoensis TaxID=253288 RepID=A0AAJ5YW13_9BASI|nr:hypothetical protein MYAM1_002516 [Malassezia yamatoensis]
MDLDARWELNSRVLRRFDPRFSQIVGTASFAVLYSYDKEWTKTGTEGPLFLYQRSEAPFISLKILNRNDPDNFSIGITPEDDIELSNEFIIYRPQQTGTSWHRLMQDESDIESPDIYGIWIFEPSQLEQLSNTIKSCQKSTSFAPTSGDEQTKSEALDLDSLFQSAKSEDGHMGPVYTESERNGASILNALFQEAAPQKAVAQLDHKSVDPSSAKSNSRPTSPSLPQSHEQASQSLDSSEKQSKMLTRDSQGPNNQFGTDGGASSINLEDLFGGFQQATIESRPISDPSQDGNAEEQTLGKSATGGNKNGKDSQSGSDKASPAKESRQESPASRGEQKTKMEPSRARNTSDDTSGAESEFESLTRPEQPPRSDQTRSLPRPEASLLSILSEAKAPEKLATEKKQLSRVEFVQTMVTLLYVRFFNANGYTDRAGVR